MLNILNHLTEKIFLISMTIVSIKTYMFCLLKVIKEEWLTKLWRLWLKELRRPFRVCLKESWRVLAGWCWWERFLSEGLTELMEFFIKSYKDSFENLILTISTFGVHVILWYNMYLQNRLRSLEKFLFSLAQPRLFWVINRGFEAHFSAR